MLLLKGSSTNSLAPKFQCKCSSLRSAWVTQRGMKLTNFRVEGWRVRDQGSRERSAGGYICSFVSFVVFPFHLAGLAQVGAKYVSINQANTIWPTQPACSKWLQTSHTCGSLFQGPQAQHRPSPASAYVVAPTKWP